MAALGNSRVALFISMVLCVAGESAATSEDQGLQELKTEVWNGFKEMMAEVQQQAEALHSKDTFKPFAEKHGKTVGEKIMEFKQVHPDLDVSPQSLIALETQQTQQLASGAGASWLCNLARPPISLAATAYCFVIFGWSMNPLDTWACFVSFLIPFEAVCGR